MAGDVETVLAALNAGQVRYLIVGDVAALERLRDLGGGGGDEPHRG